MPMYILVVALQYSLLWIFLRSGTASICCTILCFAFVYWCGFCCIWQSSLAQPSFHCCSLRHFYIKGISVSHFRKAEVHYSGYKIVVYLAALQQQTCTVKALWAWHSLVAQHLSYQVAAQKHCFQDCFCVRHIYCHAMGYCTPELPMAKQLVASGAKRSTPCAASVRE